MPNSGTVDDDCGVCDGDGSSCAYWYCRDGPAADAPCYPFGDKAINEDGDALPQRAFPSGNWCKDEGDVTNLIQDGVYYVCPENYGHDGSYESLKSYCAQWEKNQGTNHVPGIGQCPAGVPVV